MTPAYFAEDPTPNAPKKRSYLPRESARHKAKRLANPPAPRTPIGRKTVPKKKNVKRRQSEFARCYHSKERVAWVKSLPCVICAGLSPFIAAVTGPRDNAHTESGGAGRKAGYETIVPLCRNHHRRLDEHRKPFDQPELRQAVKDCASRIEASWQKVAFSGFGGKQ